MAEIQPSGPTGETAARFVEFVMMQAQNASLFLGLIPHPQSGQPEVNLDLARMFIDQLDMIQEKTRGNLTTEEAGVLRNALSNLQMAFFEVSQGAGSAPKAPASRVAAAGSPPAEGTPEPAQPAAEASAVSPPPAAMPAEPAPESKKRFSKSYGS